jgi:hypothetical protein
MDGVFCPEDGDSTSLKHLYIPIELHGVLAQNKVIWIGIYREALCMRLYTLH